MTIDRRTLLTAGLGLPFVSAPAIAQVVSPFTDRTIEAFLIDRVSRGEFLFEVHTPAMRALASRLMSGLYLERVSMPGRDASVPTYRLTKIGVRHGHYLLAERLWDGAGGARSGKLMRDCYAYIKGYQRDTGRQFVKFASAREMDLIKRMKQDPYQRTIYTLDDARQNGWKSAYLQMGLIRPYGYLTTTNYFIVEGTPKLREGAY